MPNEIEIQRPNLVQLQPEKNFFQKYAEQVVRTAIVGQLLRFSKGDWLLGRDQIAVPVGTTYAVDMDRFAIGWMKWVNSQPERIIMGQFDPAPRATLGDIDESLWEIGPDGAPRDPWQFTNRLILKPPGEPFAADRAATFETSSKGGIGACGKLAEAYGTKLALNDSRNPVVELGVDSYAHPNKAFGRIKVPTLSIVDWEDKSLFTEIVDEPEPSRTITKSKRRATA